MRDPIEFVVLDELNKYAPRDGDSPIKETLIDIAQRGRSLGVILVGAQQQASLVASEITQNAAIRIAGRLDAAEAERSEYGWLGPGRAGPGAAADAGARAGEPAERARADRGGDPLPALGDHIRARSRRRRPGRRRDRRVRVKLLHTGDWHLGKRLYGVGPRSTRPRRALAQVAEVAAARGALTRSWSRATCSTAAWSTRRRSAPACGRWSGSRAIAPVLAVAGNHDDPDLWVHLAPYLGAHRASTWPDGCGRPREAVVTVPTPAGPAARGPAAVAGAGPHVARGRGQRPGRAAALRRPGRRRGGAATRRRRARAARATAASRSCVAHLMVERALRRRRRARADDGDHLRDLLGGAARRPRLRGARATCTGRRRSPAWRRPAATPAARWPSTSARTTTPRAR